MKIPDRETQNDIILATLGRLVMGEWGQMAENIGCLVRTGTVVSDPAINVRREYLSAPKYAGKPEGFDFAPIIADALDNGEAFDRKDPLLRAYLFGMLINDEPRVDQMYREPIDDSYKNSHKNAAAA
ncbi:hypothetical protein KY333_03470 [Candidatus Woesearchaeota archaeon]|nr:hypothetical protein [Candidatus Woesearchaeota archaeon]MBW2994242.1 hypothetical protein [Candidatus Woesearchaeota archaeon]